MVEKASKQTIPSLDNRETPMNENVELKDRVAEPARDQLLSIAGRKILTLPFLTLSQKCSLSVT